MSASYKTGFTVGVVIGLVVAAVLLTILIKKTAYKYDERQKAVQGVAAKAGFYTLMGFDVINALYVMCLGDWGDIFTYAMLGICVSVTVYAAICVFNGAYTPLKKKPAKFMLLFMGLATMNAGVGFINLNGKSIVENGIVTYRCVNFMVAIMLVIATLIMAAYQLKCRRESEGSDEES